MRKTIFIVLLALVALAPIARAQTSRGYYDQYGQYHAYSQNDGYYDRNGQWHPYDDRDRDNSSRSNGYYDNNGVWHPNDTQSGGYYDQSGRWHAYDDDRYGRVAAPTRWTWSDNRGRAESLSTAARNLASTVSALGRESYRRSGYDDPAALDALRRLDETTREFARVAQTRSRGDLVGAAYASLVDSYFAARDRFGALGPDGRQSNLFQVMSSALGRIDKRYFGNRVFGGQNPADAGYAYDRSNGYDRYGNPLPGYDRNGRDTRPYPY